MGSQFFAYNPSRDTLLHVARSIVLVNVQSYWKWQQNPVSAKIKLRYKDGSTRVGTVRSLAMGFFWENERDALKSAEDDIYESVRRFVTDSLSRYLDDAHQGKGPEAQARHFVREVLATAK